MAEISILQAKVAKLLEKSFTNHSVGFFERRRKISFEELFLLRAGGKLLAWWNLEVGDTHGEAASQVEEEGTHALEVGPEAHAAEAPQDQAAEDL
ncbi:MAG: hypothetical protein ACE5OT_04935, partial [Candidatus Hadarchaeaceae archaeon]